MTDEEEENGPLGLVSLGMRRLTEKGQKIAYLEFDGKDPRPECPGSAVVLLLIGPEPAETPPVELAPLATVKDGRRRIQVLKLPPAAVQFGEQRVAAYARRAGHETILLTATSPIAPGPYAFNAGVSYELDIGR
jgi:hypothetical protein